MDYLLVLRVALKVLSEKLAVFLSLVLAAFLAGWVMYQPDPLRVAALGIFSVFALLIGRKEGNHAKDQSAPARDQSAE